jgi:hypothetical protein
MDARQSVENISISHGSAHFRTYLLGSLSFSAKLRRLGGKKAERNWRAWATFAESILSTRGFDRYLQNRSAVSVNTSAQVITESRSTHSTSSCSPSPTGP